MNEPSIDKVGYLIKLSCGHNGKLSDIELGLLRMQLEKAGFTREIPSNDHLSNHTYVSELPYATKLKPINEPNKPHETPVSKAIISA